MLTVVFRALKDCEKFSFEAPFKFVTKLSFCFLFSIISCPGFSLLIFHSLFSCHMWGLMSFSQQSVQHCFIHFRDLSYYTNLHTYIHPQLITVFYFSSVMVYWSRSHINRAYSCDSYAIGGLAGGESKDSFWRVVAQCTAALPEDKPRYVMVQISFIKSTYIVQTNLNSCELGGSSFHIFPCHDISSILLFRVLVIHWIL